MPPITNKPSLSLLLPASPIKKRHSIGTPGLDTPEHVPVPRMDRRSSEGSPTNMTGLTQRSISRKRQPYVASRTWPDVFLNCEAEVLSSTDAERTRELVVCRHLAYQFATADGKKRDLMQKYRTVEGIQTQFNGKLDSVRQAAEAAWTQADPASKHLLNAVDLGHYLEALANALGRVGQEERSQVNCLVGTGQHLMALHMSRKSKEGVEYFSAKLYDPNTTAAYKRVEVTAAEGFGRLTIESMMVHPEFISACGWLPGATRPMVALCLDPQLKIEVDRHRLQVNATNMAVAMRYGSLDDVGHLLTEAGKKKTVGSTDVSAGTEKFGLADLLGAKDVNARPCLQLAMYWGHASTVKAFVEAVLDSGLSDSKMAELLSCVGQWGIPGLNFAAGKGHASTVKAFLDSVMASDLSDDKKAELLACEDSNGRSGLGCAIANGQAGTVKPFLDAIQAADLSDDKKAGLLACEDRRGLSGLYFAASSGHAVIVEALLQAMAALDLPEDRKAQLLGANGGLAKAIQNNHQSTVAVFTDVVTRSALSPRLKEHLLAPRVRHQPL